MERRWRHKKGNIVEIPSRLCFFSVLAVFFFDWTTVPTISSTLETSPLTVMKGSDLPDFKDLPPVPGQPDGCAWGLWDRDGKRDNIGSLNLLTPDVVLEAKKEIQSGTSVSLKYAKLTLRM